MSIKSSFTRFSLLIATVHTLFQQGRNSAVPARRILPATRQYWRKKQGAGSTPRHLEKETVLALIHFPCNVKNTWRFRDSKIPNYIVHISLNGVLIGIISLIKERLPTRVNKTFTLFLAKKVLSNNILTPKRLKNIKLTLFMVIAAFTLVFPTTYFSSLNLTLLRSTMQFFSRKVKIESL